MFSAVGKIGEAGNEVIRNINREENLLSATHEPKLQVNNYNISVVTFSFQFFNTLVRFFFFGLENGNNLKIILRLLY